MMSPEARSLSAELRIRAPDRIVAVHEAGHAVAHILTAEEMGLSPKQAVAYVEMFDTPRPARDGYDGPGLCQAVIDAPWFSLDLLKVALRMGGSAPKVGDELFEYARRVVTEARRRGVLVDLWVRTRVLQCVFGPAAEAKLLGKPFAHVWSGPGALNDVWHTGRDCALAGLTAAETNAVVDRAANRALRLLDRPVVWRAVMAVAGRLPAVGRVGGKEIAAAARLNYFVRLWLRLRY